MGADAAPEADRLPSGVQASMDGEPPRGPGGGITATRSLETAFRRAAPGERGQALILGLLVLAATLAGAMVIVGLATAVALRAAAQSAVDAAALACASDAIITRQVDARGIVYGTVVAVAPGAPSAAVAAWQANAAAWPLRALVFRASPSAATCTVSVRVAARIGALAAVNGADFTWSTRAEARVYAAAG